MGRKLITAILISSAVICAAACGANNTYSAQAAGAPAAEGQVPKITVSASGSVSLVPDKAAVSFGVTTKGDTAGETQGRNSESVKKVMDVLTSRGVEEKSIKTTNYNMYPQYDYSDDGDQSIIGYVVTTTISVEDQDINELGDLLETCVAAGINTVDSIRFLCSGYDEAYSEALTQAIAASKEKAEVIAAAAGKKLGEAVAVSEGWQDTSAKYGRETAVYGMEEAAMDSAAPVLAPGETEITANVTVDYEMK